MASDDTGTAESSTEPPASEAIADAPATSPVARTGPGTATSRARRVAGIRMAGGGRGASAGRPPQPADAEPESDVADDPDVTPGTDTTTPGTVTPGTEKTGTDTPAEEHRGARAGRNLPAAIGVGLGLGVVILACLFGYRPSFAYVIGAAVFYGSWEITRALRSAGIRISLLPILVGSAAMLVAAWERGPSGLVLAALVTVLGTLVWRLGDGAKGFARDAAASAFVVLYLPMLAGFAVLLTHPHDGAARVIAFIATVVCSDTGGYVTGVFFGRHPLAPIVSRAKTWEGFAGSLVACCAAGVLFMVFTFHHEWWKGLLFGLGVVIVATLGDLGESMIKRDLGVKDMGSLLPGHGGIMDRLDSLLPCAAVAYLLLSWFAPV